jgi:DNA-binding GntR family transcriptional regulator
MEVVIEAGLHARDVMVHSGEHWPDSVPVHRAILDAIEAGDGAAAATAVETLLEQASVDAARLDGATTRARRSPTARRSRPKREPAS